MIPFINGISGGMLKEAGYNMQIESLKAASQSYYRAAEFNSEMDRIDTQRRTSAQSRQLGRVISSQVSAAAGSGFSSQSGSFLAVMADSAAQVERQIRQENASLMNRTTARNYEAQAKGMQINQQIKSLKTRRTFSRIQTFNNLVGSLGSISGGSGGTPNNG